MQRLGFVFVPKTAHGARNIDTASREHRGNGHDSDAMGT
jgi:hypothetical protein